MKVGDALYVKCKHTGLTGRCEVRTLPPYGSARQRLGHVMVRMLPELTPKDPTAIGNDYWVMEADLTSTPG